MKNLQDALNESIVNEGGNKLSINDYQILKVRQGDAEVASLSIPDNNKKTFIMYDVNSGEMNVIHVADFVEYFEFIDGNTDEAAKIDALKVDGIYTNKWHAKWIRIR